MKKLTLLFILLMATKVTFGATDLILPQELRKELQTEIHKECGWDLTELRHIKTTRYRIAAGIQGVYDLEYTTTLEATLKGKKTILTITQIVFEHDYPYPRELKSNISRFSDKNGLCK